MATQTIRFDVKQILGKVDAIEKQLIPRAARLAANRAAFDATVALKEEAQREPRPQPLFGRLVAQPTK